MRLVDDAVDGILTLEVVRSDGSAAQKPLRSDVALPAISRTCGHGCGVLHGRKLDSQLRNILVVMLTTPPADEDIVKSYAALLHAQVVGLCDVCWRASRVSEEVRDCHRTSRR